VQKIKQQEVFAQPVGRLIAPGVVFKTHTHIHRQLLLNLFYIDAVRIELSLRASWQLSEFMCFEH
jgi:hypothetical protein